jgi:hypothetical protein
MKTNDSNFRGQNRSRDESGLCNYVQNTGDSGFTRFRCLYFHIRSGVRSMKYPICGQFLRPITYVEPSPHLSENVIEMISLSQRTLVPY